MEKNKSNTSTITLNDSSSQITSLTSNYTYSSNYCDNSNWSITTNRTIPYNIEPSYYEILMQTTNTSFVLDNNDTYQLIIKEKENENKMTNNFGPYSNPNLRLSPYGIAIKNRENKWVAYNKESGHLIDVNIINIEIDTSKLFYRIPKALKDIEVGNLLIHNNELVFVEKIENSRFEVLNPASGTVMTIVPSISPFGFDYLDAIISLTDYLPEADIDNPFGNLLPFMMMGKDNSVIALLMAMGGDIKDIDPILLLAASGNNALLMLSLMNKKTKTREKILQEKLATLQKKNNAL